MAKTSGKSTKNSGKTEKAVTGPEKAKKTTSNKSKKGSASKKKSESSKKPASKSNEFICQHCQKPLKSKKTLMIHERNCKTKLDMDEKKDFESALIKIKDNFDDERQALESQFMKREDALQKELDEMRTVLRMEIDRHRKELDMIRKVEKEVHEVAENQAIPDTTEPISQPQKTEPSKSPPKAIDMIPTPLPEIPKRAYMPEMEPKEMAPEPQEVIEKTQETIPEKKEPIPEPVKEQEKTVPQPAVQPIPAEPVAVPGMSKEDIEELVKSLIQKSDIKLPAQAQGSTPESDELKSKLINISRRMDSLENKIDRFNNDMKRELERFERESSTKKIEKEIDKISDKVIDMMEDIGFGEDLSVTKIPPTILEIVYQATLDDIHREIVRVKGHQDAELMARTALEEVRLKTSGSELFKFDGRKIVTDNLAKSIEANLISAKQIQTTYDVLLEKLLEAVPHHKAKNFRGMIKVKSQEFAVDRATVLTKDYGRIEKIIESTSQMVAAISAQSNARGMEFNEAIEDIKNNLLAAKADQEEIEHLRAKIQERDEIDARLADEIALLKAEMEMKEQIKAKEDEEEHSIIVPGETIDTEEIIESKEKSEEKPDISPLVLGSIINGSSSKTAIIRDTGLEEDDILAAISGLIKDNKIIEKKVGKRIKYVTPEQEIDDKLKNEDKPKKKSKTKKEKPDTKKKETKKTKSEEKSGKKSKSKKEKLSSDKKQKDELPKDESPKDELPAVESPKEEVPTDERLKKEKPKKKPDTKKEAPKEKPEPKKKKAKLAEEKPVKEAKKKKPEPAKEEKTEPAPKKEEKPEPVKDAEDKEPKKEAEKHVEDELPVITKKLEDLSEDERHVLDVISKEGMTISGIQAKAGKDIKRFALLRALRVLIDSGYVGIITKGRMDLYQKINVKKMDKNNKEINSKEVK